MAPDVMPFSKLLIADKFANSARKFAGRTAGRVAGVPNKTTAMVKEMIEDAALEIGGLSALVKWITKTPKNEYAFWTAIFPRLLPLQVRGPGERGELLVKTELTMEELRRALQARGLPVSVFGVDIPVLEEAEKVNGS